MKRSRVFFGVLAVMAAVATRAEADSSDASAGTDAATAISTPGRTAEPPPRASAPPLAAEVPATTSPVSPAADAGLSAATAAPDGTPTSPASVAPDSPPPSSPVPAVPGDASATATEQDATFDTMPPGNALSVYARTGADLYLSRFQTAGGVGGGVGARYTFGERFIAQADVSHLSQLGSAYAVRLGGGIQKRGLWAPMATVTLTTFLGDRLRFLTSQHPTAVEAPAMALGLSVAPIRFLMGSSEITVLELGAGVGWDWPGAGFAIHASLLEVGYRF